MKPVPTIRQKNRLPVFNKSLGVCFCELSKCTVRKKPKFSIKEIIIRIKKKSMEEQPNIPVNVESESKGLNSLEILLPNVKNPTIRNASGQRAFKIAIVFLISVISISPTENYLRQPIASFSCRSQCPD